MSGPYRTTDGDLVAYFCYRGRKITGVSTEAKGRRILFDFDDCPELHKDVSDYYNDTTSVIPRVYSEQIKKVRIIISTTKRQVRGEEEVG